jgi:hypothetical protein
MVDDDDDDVDGRLRQIFVLQFSLDRHPPGTTTVITTQGSGGS